MQTLYESNSFHVTSFSQGTKGQIQGQFTPGQHALMTNVNMGVRAIGSTVDDLSAAQDLPDLGSDPVSMQAISSATDYS